MLGSGGSEAAVVGLRDGDRHPGDLGRVARVGERDADHGLSGGADGVKKVAGGVGGDNAPILTVTLEGTSTITNNHQTLVY